MTAWVLAIAGALAACTAEWLYKQQFMIEGVWSHIWLWLPLQAVIGYCIFRMANLSGNLIDAFVLFTFASAALRICVSTILLHQTIPIQSWVAFSLVLGAACVKTFWSQA